VLDAECAQMDDSVAVVGGVAFSSLHM
jgi:hypothetical protein